MLYVVPAKVRKHFIAKNKHLDLFPYGFQGCFTLFQDIGQDLGHAISAAATVVANLREATNVYWLSGIVSPFL